MKFQAILQGHGSATFEGETPKWSDKKITHYHVTCKCGDKFSSGKPGAAEENSPENRQAWRGWHMHVI